MELEHWKALGTLEPEPAMAVAVAVAVATVVAEPWPSE